MAGKAVRPREATVMSAAEMRATEAMPAMSMTAAMSVATTMTASMATAAFCDHIARQRHRQDNDCNSNCPSDHGLLLCERAHRCIR